MKPDIYILFASSGSYEGYSSEPINYYYSKEEAEGVREAKDLKLERIKIIAREMLNVNTYVGDPINPYNIDRLYDITDMNGYYVTHIKPL